MALESGTNGDVRWCHLVISMVKEVAMPNVKTFDVRQRVFDKEAIVRLCWISLDPNPLT